jgi:hypothetical protein
VEARRVLTDGAGLSIERITDGREPAFDALARYALGSSGQDFIVFPCPDGATGDRAVYVIPLE